MKPSSRFSQCTPLILARIRCGRLSAWHGATQGFCTWQLCLGFMAVLIVVPGCTPSQQTETSPLVPRDQLALLSQKPEDVHRKNTGCLSCHAPIETPSMHRNPVVQAACVDCHGAASVFVPAGAAQGSAAYEQAKTQAHVQPRSSQSQRAHFGQS